MTNKNFDFLQDPNKIAIAKEIEKKYWDYYFNHEGWSTRDLDFQLTKIIYQSEADVVLTMDEYCKVIDIIENK